MPTPHGSSKEPCLRCTFLSKKGPISPCAPAISLCGESGFFQKGPIFPNQPPDLSTLPRDGNNRTYQPKRARNKTCYCRRRLKAPEFSPPPSSHRSPKPMERGYLTSMASRRWKMSFGGGNQPGPVEGSSGPGPSGVRPPLGSSPSRGRPGVSDQLNQPEALSLCCDRALRD